MAPESMAQESERRECETLNAGETEYSPESAKEQALDGFF